MRNRITDKYREILEDQLRHVFDGFQFQHGKKIRVIRDEIHFPFVDKEGKNQDICINFRQYDEPVWGFPSQVMRDYAEQVERAQWSIMSKLFGLKSEMDTIRYIKEVYGVELPREYSSWEGYEFKVGIDVYHFLIEGGQQCCERSGYFDTSYDLEDFAGAKLLSLDIVNTGLGVVDLLEKHVGFEFHDVEENVMFVNLNTDAGLLQLAVYNSHNGYYGHDVVVLKNGEILSEEVL